MNMSHWASITFLPLFHLHFIPLPLPSPPNGHSTHATMTHSPAVLQPYTPDVWSISHRGCTLAPLCLLRPMPRLRWVCLQAKECQGLPARAEAKRKSWNRFSPRAFGENMALQTLWLRISSLQNCERINFYSIKLPSLGQFVIAALEN